MYSQKFDPLPKRRPHVEAAYQRAMNALIAAWGQGVRQEPLARDALWVAEFADNHTHARTNIVREKYQRGLDRLPFEG